MRHLLILASLVCTSAAFAASSPTNQTSYRWCTVDGNGSRNCYFKSLTACEKWEGGQGCIPNPDYKATRSELGRHNRMLRY
jgi:hypothetical protein